MKDKVLDRAKGWDNAHLKGPDGKGFETEFPKQNPGDSVANRPAKQGPHVPTNT